MLARWCAGRTVAALAHAKRPVVVCRCLLSQEPLNASKHAARAHLDQFVHSARGTGSEEKKTHQQSIRQIIRTSRKLGDIDMTRSVISAGVNINDLSRQDFISVLLSFQDVRDAESALNFYHEACLQNSSLISVQALQCVLTTLKFSKAHLSAGMQLYRDALADTVRFPHLKTDALAVNAVIALYLAADADDGSLLQSAVALKNDLIAAGGHVPPSVYQSLIILAGKHRNFAAAVSLADVCAATGREPSVAVESALLYAAVQSRAHDEAATIYQRIAKSDSLGVNADVVDTMLRMCRETGDKQQCVQVTRRWQKSDGVLTWPMCISIAQTLMTPQLLRATACNKAVDTEEDSSKPDTSADAEPVIQKKGEVPHIPAAKVSTKAGAPIKSAHHGNKRVESKEEMHERLSVRVVQQIVRQTTDALHTFQRRSRGEQRNGLHQPGQRLADHGAESHVPGAVLPSIAALLVLRGQADVLFARLDSPLATRSVQARRAEHQRVVRQLAHDLALLGKWRDLMALCSRLRSYCQDGDELAYPAAAVQHVRICLALGLLRAGRYAHADEVIDDELLVASKGSVDALREVLGGAEAAALFPEELKYVTERFAAFATPPVV